MQEAMRRGAYPGAALEQASADGGAGKHNHAQPLAARLGSHAGSADGAALRGRAWSRRSREGAGYAELPRFGERAPARWRRGGGRLALLLCAVLGTTAMLVAGSRVGVPAGTGALRHLKADPPSATPPRRSPRAARLRPARAPRRAGPPRPASGAAGPRPAVQSSRRRPLPPRPPDLRAHTQRPARARQAARACTSMCGAAWAPRRPKTAPAPVLNRRTLSLRACTLPT